MKNLFASSVSKVLVGSLLIAGLASGLNIVSASTSYNGLLDPISDPVSPSPTPISNPVGSKIKIYAGGTSANKIYPTMILALNGKYVTQWDNVSFISTNGWREYMFSFQGKVTADQIGLGFTNDLWLPEKGEDRNLFVDKIVLDGIEYQTEAPSTYANGVAFDGKCNKGFLKAQVLHCNGYFVYSVNPTISSPVR